MIKLVLEKAEEPEIKLPISIGSSKNQESSRKTCTSALFDYARAFHCVDYNKLWKILKKSWDYQNILPALWKMCMQVKKHRLEPDMEQQTGCKLGKEYVMAVYCLLFV